MGCGCKNNGTQNPPQPQTPQQVQLVQQAKQNQNESINKALQDPTKNDT
jgi:hypothetical protein